MYGIINLLPIVMSTEEQRVNESLNDRRSSLITAYENAIATIRSLTGTSTIQNDQISDKNTRLQSEVDELSVKLNSLKNEEQKYMKEFQDAVYYKPDTTSQINTLQDFSLAMFAFAWFILGAILVSVGAFLPGGTWKRGLIIAVLFFIITSVVFSLMSVYL